MYDSLYINWHKNNDLIKKGFFLYPLDNKAVGGGGVYWFHSVRLSIRLSVPPACHVPPTGLHGFFAYQVQIIISMRGCVAHNDLWPWPIAIKLLRYGISCPVCSTAHTVLDKFFPYVAQMITSMGGFIACNDHWSWPLSSKSFSHDLAINFQDNRSKITQVIQMFAVRVVVFL